jgi:hypothetical protein
MKSKGQNDGGNSPKLTKQGEVGGFKPISVENWVKNTAGQGTQPTST